MSSFMNLPTYSPTHLVRLLLKRKKKQFYNFNVEDMCGTWTLLTVWLLTLAFYEIISVCLRDR